uniref:Uncharacterized protein n=1 Tax=viral metagenome TaxID=1070528 RepID=A0A6C0BLI1_9ZZZZ
MIIPEEIAFNIYSYSGEAFPGLTKQYILQEIDNLHIDYSDIREQAEALHLTNLFKYVTEPVSISSFTPMDYISKASSYPSRYYDWSNFITYLNRSGSQAYVTSTISNDNVIHVSTHFNDEATLTSSTQHIPQGVTFSLNTSTCKLDINLSLPEVTEFLQQIYILNSISNPHALPGRFSFIGLFSEITQITPSCNLEHIQNDIYNQLRYGQSIDLPSYSTLSEVLKYQRRRNSFIRSILQGSQIVDGVHLRYYELKLLDYLIEWNIPCSTGVSSMRSYNITTCMLDEVHTNNILTILKCVDPHVTVSSGYRSINFSVKGLISDCVGGNSLEGSMYRYYDLRALMGYVQYLNSPLTLIRTMIVLRGSDRSLGMQAIYQTIGRTVRHVRLRVMP